MKFQLEGGGFPSPPSFGYAFAPIEENRKGVRRFFARFLTFSNKISTVQKTVLSSSRGQSSFRGLEALRPRTSKCVLEAKDVFEESTSAKTISGHSKGTEGLDANIFELLIVKHERANVNVESEESMCVIMKCNTDTMDGL